MNPPEAEKACAFCAETIKAAAIVCKHCGRDLPAMKTADEQAMERLGITYQDSRYVWRGNHFRDLAGAVAFAERNPSTLAHTPPLKDADRADAQKPFKWWLWGPLGVVVALFALGLIAGQSPEAKERSKERLAIEWCWKEHDRKSFDAGTKQFVAGACERMESDFKAKWGASP